MLRLLAIAFSTLTLAEAFVHTTPSNVALHSIQSCLYAKQGGAGDAVVQQKAVESGSFVEFVEKKRTHIGKIDAVEHKSSGGARYQ